MGLLLSSPKTSLSWADCFSVSGTLQFPPAADLPSSHCFNLLSFSPAGPGAVRGRAPQELLQIGVTLVLGEAPPGQASLDSGGAAGWGYLDSGGAPGWGDLGSGEAPPGRVNLGSGGAPQGRGDLGSGGAPGRGDLGSGVDLAGDPWNRQSAGTRCHADLLV